MNREDIITKLPVEYMKKGSLVDRAKKLTHQTGNVLSSKIKTLLEYLEALDITIYVNCNIQIDHVHGTVGTCAEIARRRQRSIAADIQAGIAEYDELKTGFYKVLFEDEGRGPLYVMTHIRGNELLDEQKVCGLMKGKEIERLSNSELEQFGGLAFGKLHPFIEAFRAQFAENKSLVPIHHLFDIDVMNSYSHLGTVMTNASDSSFSLEFDPKKAVQVLNATVESITRNGPSETLKSIHGALHTIVGINGGNSTHTLQKFEKLLRENFTKKLSEHCYEVDHLKSEKRREKLVRILGDLSEMSTCTFSSPKSGLSMSLDNYWEEVIESDLKIFRMMTTARVRLVTMPCHTRIIFENIYKDYCEELGMKFLSIADATMEAMDREIQYLRDTQERIKVLFLGGAYALDSDKGVYKKRISQHYKTDIKNEVVEITDGVEYMNTSKLPVQIVFPNTEDAEMIQSAMFDIKSKKFSKGIAKLYSIVLDKQDFDLIVLASTELSALDLSSHKKVKQKNVKIVDGLDAYARMVVDRMFTT